jgi:hypothetical protein
VATVVALSNGRRIELSYDLDGLVDCRAMDLGIGRDISADLMHDGTPDGAKLLGLTRETLLPTICVRQADLLGVLKAPDALQESLQRAADTGGADETCEQALVTIDEFRRTRIGSSRAPTRPLMQSHRAVEDAETALRHATDAHREFLAVARQRDDAQRAAQELSGRLAQTRAAVWRRTLAATRARLEEIRRLQAQFPEAAQPDAPGTDALDDQVTRALSDWQRRPHETELPEGPTAEELAAELAALPEHPGGDVEVVPEMRRALEDWRRAAHTVELHDQRPEQFTVAEQVPEGATPAQLRAVANDLEAPVPVVDERLRTQVEEGQRRSRAPVGLALTAIVAALAGVGLLAAGQLTAGFALLATAVALGAYPVTRGRAGANVAELEAKLAVQQAAAEQAQQRRDAAREKAEAWLRTADPAKLRQIARAADEREAAKELAGRRQHEATRHDAALQSSARRLQELLAERGVEASADRLEEAFASYDEVCRRRAHQAAAASRAPELRSRLEDRRRLEQVAASQRQDRDQAELELRVVVEACGLDQADIASPGVLVEWLTRWREQRASARQKATARWETWLRLQTLLEDDDPEHLDAKVARLEADLAALGDIEPCTLPDRDADTLLDRLQEEEHQAQLRVAEFEARLQDQARDLPGVADAEVRLQEAVDERDRLQALDKTLARTTQFLVEARDRIHRDIAPRLRASVQRWLPAISDSRYAEVTVNPSTLQITVRGEGRPWRDATLLSHGTAEQIHLLLRVALAEHLITTGEPAPLILDDPTVQADSARTVAIMDLLHQLSIERQVIVFTQEDEGVAWAQQHLLEPQDKCHRLDAAGIPP